MLLTQDSSIMSFFVDGSDRVPSVAGLRNSFAHDIQWTTAVLANVVRPTRNRFRPPYDSESAEVTPPGACLGDDRLTVTCSPTAGKRLLKHTFTVKQHEDFSSVRRGILRRTGADEMWSKDD
jgi:hypothetical protein